MVADNPALTPPTQGLSEFQLQRLLHALQGDAQTRRPFKAPELPPGVVPVGTPSMAHDSAVLGMYSWLNHQPGWCGLGFPGYTYLSELAQRSEYRSPAETTAGELTRRWLKFHGADEAKLKELNEAFQQFRVRDHIRTMVVYDMLFGRGQLYIKIKGHESLMARKRPLVVDDDNAGKTIKQGSLEGFVPIEPIWSTPNIYNTNDPTAPYFYDPEAWYVMGNETHASRLLTFIARPLPDIFKPAYNFSGMSMSQLIEPYVSRWLKTVDSVNRLISNFAKQVIKTNMQQTLQGDGNAADSLNRRIQLYTAMGDNRGVLALDMDSEDYVLSQVSLASLDKLQAQAQEHMAAPTHIPLVKLTGITPSGLNASSEEDLIVWYDWCAAEQINFLDPHVVTISKLVQLHLWGKVDPDITHEWVALDAPTEKEQSEIRKADGDRDTAYVGSGVISPDEVRERLRNDPNSGYTFLEGEAPTPPDEAEHELGQAAAEADHERGEESAAVAHERSEESAVEAHKREVQLAKAAPKKD